ncbi:MAG TPA: hypothetical protein QGF58_17615 [Myxococcota bacterium]|nr:hypothetical protein [Myxococcota bacterium]
MSLLIAILSANDASAAESSPYVSTRATTAASAGGEGLAFLGSVGFGAEWDNGQSLGMRFIGVPNPPDTLWLKPGPYAAGPAIDWRWYIPVTDHFDMYPAASFGVLYAPERGTNRNLLLPVAEGGFGTRFKLTGEQGSVWFAPEFDIVPLAAAAAVSANFGMTF